MKEFKCNRCGYCCTLIPKITLFEALRIRINGHKDFTTKDGSKKRCIRMIAGDCFFLERHGKTATCKIYNIRPKVCREYPYGQKNNFGKCEVDKRSFKEKYLT